MQAAIWFRKNTLEQESKSETEKLLRQAMDDYESKKFIAKSENITIGELLDIWAEEELKTGTLSNGTVQNYLGAITNIKKHPISERKLKNVTSEHLQAFFNLLSFGGTYPDGSERKRLQQRLHSFFLGSITAVIPICSITKAIYHFQSDAVY